MNEKLQYLRTKALSLPINPGVYIMKDSHGKIIYIGKAKVLKDRVSQYFGSQKNHEEKVRKMVENVSDFEYILTDSEFEALVLECSLIKQNSPKYNILLKDDKGYSYIKITNEKWPRIYDVKQVENDGATYIGPYTSSAYVTKAVEEALSIFRLPRCRKDFSRQKSGNRACLNFYINQCSAPCVGKISHGEYMENINDAIEFLKGGDSAALKKLTQKMQDLSENLQYEKAAKVRDKILALKKISEKQKVVSTSGKNQDVIALVQAGGLSSFEVFRFVNGKLCDRDNYILNEVGNAEIVRSEFIVQYYLKKTDIPATILLDGAVDAKVSIEAFLSQKQGKKVSIMIPQKGESLRLVEMCRNNAAERISQRLGRTFKETAALDELAKLLSLPKTPVYIEAYDISNTAGSENVAGMVVFKNGRPLKSNYKKFAIKSVIGQDDYASMCEVISRRLDRFENATEETNDGFERLPDLILLDGGKGHVGAVKSLLQSRRIDIPVYGMVKDDKHRTKAIAKDGGEIAINSNRAAFTLISSIQDEVHRFAIGYHRQKRKINTLTTVLTQIPGIGTKKAQRLFTYFKTVDRIKNASVEELTKVSGINQALALNVLEYFEKNNI